MILRDCYSGCIRVRREGLGRARGHTGETGAIGDELGMGQERVEASYQFLPLMEQLVSFLVALWSFVFLLQVLLEQCQKKRNFKLFTNSGHYIEVLNGNHVFFILFASLMQCKLVSAALPKALPSITPKL